MLLVSPLTFAGVGKTVTIRVKSSKSEIMLFLEIFLPRLGLESIWNLAGRACIMKCSKRVHKRTDLNNRRNEKTSSCNQADELRYESIRQKEDFTFETVLSSEYKIRILRAAKEAGYFIKCVFVLTASADLNIARVRSRASLGGHDVEPGKVRERYRKSLSNISVLMEICDILHVYDNTNSKPVRIVRKHKDDITIYPNKDWSEAALLSLING